MDERRRSVGELDKLDQALVDEAYAAAENAYAPYSRFSVGAAARSIGGRIFHGSNMENASYGMTMCAEVAALTRSVSDGDFQVESIAVIGWSQLDRGAAREIVSPCGRCRQLILEAGHVAGVDVRVIMCTGDKRYAVVAPISELLPMGFGPKNLPVG